MFRFKSFISQIYSSKIEHELAVRRVGGKKRELEAHIEELRGLLATLAAEARAYEERSRVRVPNFGYVIGGTVGSV